MDADPRAVQQIVFQGVVEGDDNTKIRLNNILEKPKETVLQQKGKSFLISINGWIQ